MDSNTFEKTKEYIRERVIGTTAILTGQQGNEEPYFIITYQPLDITVQVPFSSNNDILVENYTTLLLSVISNKIVYHDRSIHSLEHFRDTIENI